MDKVSMFTKSFIFAWMLLVSFSAALFAEEEKTKHNAIFDLNYIKKLREVSLNDVCDKEKLFSQITNKLKTTQAGYHCIEKTLIIDNESPDPDKPNLLIVHVNNMATEEFNEKISEINETVFNKGKIFFTTTKATDAITISSLEELKIPLTKANTFDEIVSMIEGESKDFIKFVQFSMQNAGYYPDYFGNDDGGFGPGSRTALKKGLNTVTEEELGGKIADFATFPHTSDRVMKVLFNGIIKLASSKEAAAQQNDINKNSKQDTAPNKPKEEQPKDTSENGQVPLDDTKSDQKNSVSWLTGKALTENARITKEIKRLEEENKRLEEKNKRLQEKLKNRADLKTIFNSELIELLDLDNQLQKKRAELTYRGQLPDKKIVDVQPSFELTDRCSFKAIDTLNEAIEKYFQKSCTNIVLKNFDVDDQYGRPREFDQKLNTLTIPILRKQASQIASIKSDPLTNLESTFDTSRCDINVEFYNNDSESVIKWSDGKPVKIYVEKVEGNVGQVYLSDENTLNGKVIEWGGRRFKLVIQNQNDSSCEISEPDSFFEFRTEDEFIDVGSSPTAVISRDGSVVLKNVPLKQAKGKTLAVFLDTFVGPDRDAPQFGFNKAMIDAEFKILQKVYFKGFLNAVNSFILETAEFGNVEIYERSNESDTNYKSIFSKTKVNFNEFEKFKDDYISNDFIAGSKGTPLKKKTNHTQLVEENKNTVFVSFGSSGHNYEKACSSESRRDFKLNFHIFDIWPTETLDDLLDNELLIAVDEKRAYRCKDAGSIMGLKVSKAREEYEIENIIYSELKRISE